MHKLPDFNYYNNNFDSGEEQNEKPKIRRILLLIYLIPKSSISIF